MHVETRLFLFLKMSKKLQRIFEIAGSFFQVLLSTFFKKSGIFNETFLTLSWLTYNIFSKKQLVSVS